MNSEQKCIICVKGAATLINLSETDCHNITWLCKLSFCVPEVHWSEDYWICTECASQLEAACAFRDLCIRSVAQRPQFELKYESIKKEFICFHCNESFVRKMLLITHLRTKHRDKTQCSYCRSTHIDDCSLSKTFWCDKCNILFKTQRLLRNHVAKCGVNKEPYNDFVTGDTDILQQGLFSKTCNICGMVFSTRYLAKRHIRNVHATEKNYQCDICQQKFASPVYLSAHKRYHSGERPHICSFCGKGFITGSDLYHHEKIHANKRAYKCDQCPKAFNTSSDLHKHKLCVHKDKSEWKYVCTYCNRRFPLKTNLDAHTKTHTGERNFACHLCDHKCVNRSVLLRHITSHSNIRLFKCNICTMEYKHKKSLDIHMRKAHGIGNAKIPERVKKYFCHVCPKSYFGNDNLQKHIRTHTGERPFSCHICEKRFIDKSYVKQHLKTAHNICFINGFLNADCI